MSHKELGREKAYRLVSSKMWCLTLMLVLLHKSCKTSAGRFSHQQTYYAGRGYTASIKWGRTNDFLSGRKKTCFQVKHLNQHEGNVETSNCKWVLPCGPLSILLVQQPVKWCLRHTHTTINHKAYLCNMQHSRNRSHHDKLVNPNNWKLEWHTISSQVSITCSTQNESNRY